MESNTSIISKVYKTLSLPFVNNARNNDNIHNLNKCKKCGKTEVMLTGSDKNTKLGNNIFSIEGLCLDCEVMIYPERFHGCGFCKRPIRERFSCTICTIGFTEWVKRSIYPTDKISNQVKKAAWDLVNKSINEMPIFENNLFLIRETDGLYKWPGFYGGVTNRFSNDDITHIPIWIIPKMTIQRDYKLTDLKIKKGLFMKLLLELLTLNGINLYSDTQIDGNSILLENIKNINTFDTRIIKNIT